MNYTDDLKKYKDYEFIDPGIMIDSELELQLEETSPYQPEKRFVPAYKFKMMNTNSKMIMGHIDLRVGLTAKLKEFGGHIGYEVEEKYRGNNYAARSCRLLFPLLRKLGINPVVITCAPDNLPSTKTIESLGAVLITTKDVEIEPGVFRLTSIYHVNI
jgi:tagatose 1,6-diphosphate aldolase